ncbi:MAG: diguanylate cyclase [Chloroflexi bacterium]|nr:diguanylate cyclase [Chloroflexota bacterium]
MPNLYFTPASISYLTQFILALAITLYLLNRLWSRRARSLFLLSAFFASMTALTGLLVLDAALSPFHRLLAAYAENAVLALALVALNAFAYQFPEIYPQRKWERRVIITLSLLFLFWEVGFMVYRYISVLAYGNVYNRFPLAAYSLPVVVLFAPIAFLRQTLAADPRRISWWRKLWKPEGKGARGARNFALVFLIPVLVGIVSVLLNFGLPFMIYSAALSVGLLFMFFLFAVNYVDFIPGGVNVASRLSTLALTLFLALLGTVGWLIAPSYVATFQPDLRDHQTLRFTPNAAGGYDVNEADFHFESALGEKILAPTLGEKASGRMMGENGNHRVEFTFPFYGKTYAELYLTYSGAIGLGQPFRPLNLNAEVARAPILFPLLIDLAPDPDEEDSGLYVREEPERLIVTWNRLLSDSQPEAHYTFQAILYADGIFEFAYNGLPQPIFFRPDSSSGAPWLRGVVAGRGEPLHELPDTDAADLITLSRAGTVPLLENFNLAFRNYLNTFMLPVAWAIIGGSLLILFFLPLLVRSSIAQPIETLAAGIRRMEAGETRIAVPVQSEDEIGFLTRSFNKMNVAIEDLVHNLEARVAERTAGLLAANLELRKLSAAVEQSPNIIIITDLNANIEYVNPAFTYFTGYALEEVKGKNPRIFKSGRTPPETYRQMWDFLTDGKTWRGELINRRKNGEHYWEYAVIAPIQNAEGVATHYFAIKEDITARKTAEGELKRLVVTDPLTGLLNRRGFVIEAERIYTRSLHPPYELAALMIDIDHFKNVNDRYGHQFGDVALWEIAARLRDNLRPTDIIARYGGEEFVALLPRTSLNTLKQITQRLNAVVREQPIEYDRIKVSITISIGASMLTAESRSLDELLTQADRAVYQAKAAGRNCTVIFSSFGFEGATESK